MFKTLQWVLLLYIVAHMTLVLQHKQLNIAKINCQQVSLTTMGEKKWLCICYMYLYTPLASFCSCDCTCHWYVEINMHRKRKQFKRLLLMSVVLTNNTCVISTMRWWVFLNETNIIWDNQRGWDITCSFANHFHADYPLQFFWIKHELIRASFT